MVNYLLDLFSCLADENRLKILLYLNERRQASVSEIAKATGNYQSLVSHHLSNLRKAGLVQRRRIGKTSVYVISDRVTKLLEYVSSTWTS
ncbi:ArsR/SmtB family transcription factor [Sulfuracidifex metallicus]|uniref:Metalloregulator ArsR/SmtB family transcription factor n=1 Tax=Sulfuracidifex metallicus DSM 6482 = JCM 9184 TaxID=523847 RepID=A0A6A9QMX3_SULME|nr:metalloregulator ArsR/SmtB family transcription factor [Sulfuracidifex metallicus]MUN29499.1 metalloregulator ArsR/SmtB family transcription factor [Sulfuracidifex metallicus DSM 6482 = JCM 9184]WOE49991.1 metalloregulator ArsR/SmtB family transcription factor [Sulfuracidifex metallicus DSM 6482 = JCM 9184]